MKGEIHLQVIGIAVQDWHRSLNIETIYCPPISIKNNLKMFTKYWVITSFLETITSQNSYGRDSSDYTETNATLPTNER